MAAQKKTKSNRQKTAKSLPVSRSKKKIVASKSAKSTSKKSTSKKPVVAKKKRVYPRKPAVDIKQLKLKVWTDTYFIIQLQRPKQPVKKRVNQLPSLKSKLQKALPLLLITAGVLGTIYFGTTLLKPANSLTIYSPPVPEKLENTKPTLLSPKSLSKSDPATLIIPDLGINSPLATVGKNPDNTLEVPSDAQAPAWYRLSPTPGELGPSIIVGHVDSPTGPAIFWRLNQLKPDQIIEIVRTDNQTAKFKVTEIKQYEQNNFPTEQVYGNIDSSGLRLITCGGTFNKYTGSYSHNTVVFAILVP